MDEERIANGGEGATPAGMVFTLVCGFALAAAWTSDNRDGLKRVWDAVADSYQVGSSYSVSASMIVPYKRKPEALTKGRSHKETVVYQVPERK